MKISKIAAIFAVGLSLLLGTGCQTNAEEDKEPTVLTNPDGTVTIKIEDNNTGLVSCNGKLSPNENSSNGYIFDNFPQTDPTNPARIQYCVNTDTAGKYVLSVHYAFGGYCDYLRDAKIYVNGILQELETENNTLNFDYTIKNWSVYKDAKATIDFVQGDNFVEIVSAVDNERQTIAASGSWVNWDNLATINNGDSIRGIVVSLPNIDYTTFTSTEKNVKMKAGSNSSAYWSLSAKSENENYGTISVTPSAPYSSGTEVTLTATAKPGYVFDCWNGDVNSNNSVYTFNIKSNVTVNARFIPENYVNEGLEGYATVCDDAGTTYTITGGFGGETITLSKLEDLTTYKSQISGNDPYIIQVTDRISTTTNKSETFDIGSNKTLIGEKGQDYGFKNINPKISGTNVIVKYLHFGEVIGDDYWGGSGNDALSIKGGKHVWIDHCEFSSKSVPTDIVTGKEIKFTDYNFVVDTEGEDCTPEEKWAKDFYDGLLDVSEQSRFISVSNSYFHDHQKACLCGGSNDKAETQPQGSLVRMTFYNNYFEKIHSRQPLFRFGRAHIYSSYYKGLGDSSGIEVRAESLVNVNSCYFEGFNSSKVVGCWNSSSGLGQGKWNVQSCEGANNSYTNTFTVPYEWTNTLASDSKTKLPTTAGIK